MRILTDEQYTKVLEKVVILMNDNLKLQIANEEMLLNMENQW